MKQQFRSNFRPPIDLEAWLRANGYPESRQAPRRIPYPTSKDEAVVLVQSLLSEHVEWRLDQLCIRLNAHCMRMGRDAFADVAAFHYVSIAVGKPPPNPPPQTPAALAESKATGHMEYHLKLVRILKECIKVWGAENQFIGFGALWKVALTDAEFLRLCGLKSDSQGIHPGDNIDEMDRYGLNARVAKHLACVMLGIVTVRAATDTERDAIRQHFNRKVSALIKFAEYTDGRGVHLPTVYRVVKSIPQIENLKALKRKMYRFELYEEPI